MEYNVVIVGAGFAGSVLARRFAEELNKKVLVVEKHNHVGGHAHDAYNMDGILVHTYGPHIFHTNSSKVFDWLSRFTTWNYYQHRVMAYVDGMLVPMPISSELINTLFGENLTAVQAEEWLKAHSSEIDPIKNSKDVVLSSAGIDIYEKIFKNYTYKQWGRYPDELSPEVIKRIPVRLSRDTRYFTDKYQGVPKLGYTELFRSILAHENIHILLNANWFDIRSKINYKKLVYTGPVDAYFDYKLGKLEYRSVRFEYETYHDMEFYQPVGTVNYPNDYDYTRISEYKHFTGQKLGLTTIAREYSSSTGEPFYTVPDEKNHALAEKYNAMARAACDTIFIGRLAEYKYYNMDQIVLRALEWLI